MQSQPAVTVIAMCYNHARFVIETLESIRAQTFQDFELIVTDDASRDNSPELIAQWLAKHRPDAHFIRHASNAGLCRTLNEALALAKGKYICMIATDDTWHTDRLERHLQALSILPESVAVMYSDANQMAENGEVLPEKFIAYNRRDAAPPSGKIFSDLVDGNFIPAMTTTIRTSAIAAVGGYDEELCFEDYDMWLRLSARFDFAFCPGTVANYRIVSNSMMRNILSRPSGHQRYTYVLLACKLLRTNNLNKEQRRCWTKVLWDEAYHLYASEDQHATSAMWRAFRYDRKPRALLLAVTNSIGLSRGRLKRWLSFPARG